MTTETKAMGLSWRNARALGWAAMLGVLLLAPMELLAQTKDKSSTGSSSGSSSSGSSSSASRSSPPPSRSSSSASRSSGGRSRSTSTGSRASSVSRSKPSTKAPSRGTTSSRTQAASGVKPSKPNSPVRIPNENDNPARAGEQANRNPSDYQYRRPGSGYGGSHHRYYYPYYPYGSFGYYGYGSYYPYYFYGPYGYFFHPYAYGPSTGTGYRRGPRYGDAMGGLDLNVRPKKAEVYIDGTPIGPVDRYDGFPSYLWLDPGTYELAFYLEGYETLTRQYSIYPGVVVDVKERLGAGAAVAPEPPELGAMTYDDMAPDKMAPDGKTSDEPPAANEEPGVGTGVGRLQLSIRPGDTAVYLDGHFLGTGEELSQLSAGLVVEPGVHVLELVRPGYVTEQVPVKVPPGDRIDVDLTLRPR